MSQNESIAWQDIQRVEGWAGEIRLNLIRLLAITVFYGRHLAEVIFGPPDSSARGQYHLHVTWLCLMWAGAAIVLHVLLTRRIVMPWLKYAVAIFDALMITLLCTIAGGPNTPLVLLYFPLIASAPLRLSLKLVYTATTAAAIGYLFVLGIYAWIVIGFHKYYATPELRIPRSQEAIVVLAMLTSGFLAGQFVRQVRRIAGGHIVTTAPIEGN